MSLNLATILMVIGFLAFVWGIPGALSIRRNPSIYQHAQGVAVFLYLLSPWIMRALITDHDKPQDIIFAAFCAMFYFACGLVLGYENGRLVERRVERFPLGPGPDEA